MNIQHIPVIICNYKHPQLTKRCAESIRKFYPTIPLIIIDDFSPSYEPFNFENCINLRTKEHLGHGNAMDVAMNKVKKRWVFTVDHDVVFTKPGYFEFLWEEKKRYVAIGPEHTYSDDGHYVHAGAALWKLAVIKKYHLSFNHYDLPNRPNINPGVLICRKLEELGYKVSYLRADLFRDFGTHETSAAYTPNDMTYGKRYIQ